MVTALLVSHDGARWLPAVLDGLLAQTRPPDRTVVVDTGSKDATIDLVTSRLGVEVLHSAPAHFGYADAVALALRNAPPLADGAPGPDPGPGPAAEWLWLLHDDSRPAPDALERLLAAAAGNPSVAILGPKIREWPSLRRLLEVGVTISATGRRETGLERGEYDQGQHDRVREVLAVSSAGMLVRRDVFEALGGFDPQLPMYGNDLDLGWRAARAGHRTLVVPDAVVFHAEATHRGLRRTRVTGHHQRGEREAALYTLLVNSSRAALPFLVVRLVVGSLLRVLGLLLVRAPREAVDELVALAAVYLRPLRVLRGRRRRRRTSTRPHAEVRHLLAPLWLPYRHGLDFVSDLAAAVLNQAADVSAARRSNRVVTEPGPVPAEAQELPPDTGLLARLLTSPTALVTACLVVLALVNARGVLGAGFLAGGALLPAPDAASDWWRMHLSSWHEVGVGSDQPAPPYVLPLAVAATMLLGKAWLVVDLLFLFAVPLSAWGAWRLLRRLIGRDAVALWGAGAYAVLPVVTGAVNQGRLGTVAAAALLPWLVHAALFLDPRQGRDRRWRAAWRTTVLLALVTAFAPLALPMAAVVAVAAMLVGRAAARGHRTHLHAWGPVLVAVGVVPLLLLPWWLGGLLTGIPGPWLAEAGTAWPQGSGDLGAWDLLLGRAGEVGAAPGWLSVGVGLAAVAALVRRDTRATVLGVWGVVLVGLAAAVVLDARGTWAGFPLLVAHGAAVTAAALGASGLARVLAGLSFGWRQVLGLLVVVSAALAPVAAVVWWTVTGVTGPLDRAPAHPLPVYMTDAALRDPDQGILVIRHEGDALGFSLVRGEGVRLGEDGLTDVSRMQDTLGPLVADLGSAPSPQRVGALSKQGVEFIYLPPPADPELAGNLDATSGLASASAIHGSRAWQLDPEPSRAAPPRPPGWLRPVLLAVQAGAVLCALVLAAPTRRTRR